MAIMINKGIKDNMDRQIQNIKYKSIIIAVLLLLFPYSIYAKVKTDIYLIEYKDIMKATQNFIQILLI